MILVYILWMGQQGVQYFKSWKIATAENQPLSYLNYRLQDGTITLENPQSQMPLWTDWQEMLIALTSKETH